MQQFHTFSHSYLVFFKQKNISKKVLYFFLSIMAQLLNSNFDNYYNKSSNKQNLRKPLWIIFISAFNLKLFYIVQRCQLNEQSIQECLLFYENCLFFQHLRTDVRENEGQFCKVKLLNIAFLTLTFLFKVDFYLF